MVSAWNIKWLFQHPYSELFFSGTAYVAVHQPIPQWKNNFQPHLVLSSQECIVWFFFSPRHSFLARQVILFFSPILMVFAYFYVYTLFAGLCFVFMYSVSHHHTRHLQFSIYVSVIRINEKAHTRYVCVFNTYKAKARWGAAEYIQRLWIRKYETR